MTEISEAVQIIRAMRPDASKFAGIGRGFVDWSFSQVAAYLGYERAQAYAESVRRWHDFAARYSDCQLERSYAAFLEAEKEIISCR